METKQIDRIGTAEYFRAKFMQGGRLDKDYFLSCVVLWVRNDERLHNRVKNTDVADAKAWGQLVRDVIRRVVFEDAVRPQDDEATNCTYSGVVSGVGGHTPMVRLTSAVSELLIRERG